MNKTLLWEIEGNAFRFCKHNWTLIIHSTEAKLVSLSFPLNCTKSQAPTTNWYR